ERATRRSVDTHDALGRPISADYLLLDEGRTAFVEMAAASGLAQLAVEERTPASARVASSRGTGELVRSALDAGVKRLILGLGGSATNDGGTGMLAALGVRCLGLGGDELPPGGAALADLIVIDAAGLDPRLAKVEVVVASDVTNPLTGPAGAAPTYGPQKGADPAAVAELDAALGVYGAAIEAATGRAVADLPGAGAAGGTGAALLGFTNATLRPGIEVVAEMVGLASALEAADLVITGEGRADEQTLAGKAAMGVALLAGKRGIPAVLLCGTLGPGSEALEVSGLFELIQPVADRPMTLAEAMADTERLLKNAAERLARSVGIGLALAERG
ncbi:MAG: glycerate kinase family protein, partial [Candidatus Limnocylindria bacterium]